MLASRLRLVPVSSPLAICLERSPSDSYSGSLLPAKFTARTGVSRVCSHVWFLLYFPSSALVDCAGQRQSSRSHKVTLRGLPVSSKRSVAVTTHVSAWTKTTGILLCVRIVKSVAYRYRRCLFEASCSSTDKGLTCRHLSSAHCMQTSSELCSLTA